MEKQAAEHLAIVLEAISFFLVTTDLYGKKRLESLKFNIKDDGLIAVLFLILIYTVCLIFLGLMPYLFYLLYKSEGGIDMLIIFIYVCLVVLSALFKVGPFASDLKASVIDFLIKFIKIEGLMLVIGALLFLAAKAIQYFYV